MKYELKYEDFSKDPVHPFPGDILVLVCQDGHKEIFREVSEPNKYRCIECQLCDSSDYWSGLNCDHWNFSCPYGCPITYTSIDTILEDL